MITFQSPLQKLLQKGVTILKPSSNYLKVTWTNADTGSNVHISNSADTLFNKVNVRNVKLGQASGSKASVKYVGSLSCLIENSHLETKPKYTLGMPENPTSTISTYALKKYSGYRKACHEMNEYLYLIDNNGNDFMFTYQNGLLKTVNGLDYILIIHPVEVTPTTCQGIIRKSSRVPKPTVKMKAYLETNKKPNMESENDAIKQQISVEVEKPPPPKMPDIQQKEVPPDLRTRTSPSDVVQHNILSLLTHLKFACRNNKAIRHIHNSGAMINLPKIRDLK